jgi:hypothetical protein
LKRFAWFGAQYRFDFKTCIVTADSIVGAVPDCPTSTIYNDTRGDAPANPETNDNIGDDFSMNVAKESEREFFSIDLGFCAGPH